MRIKPQKLRMYLQRKNLSPWQFARQAKIDYLSMFVILHQGGRIGYRLAARLVFRLGAKEAAEIIDWEGMKIERPEIQYSYAY